MSISNPAARPFPWIELLLIIGLPVCVLFAGAFTTALAMQHAFTPVPEQTPAAVSSARP